MTNVIKLCDDTMKKLENYAGNYDINKIAENFIIDRLREEESFYDEIEEGYKDIENGNYIEVSAEEFIKRVEKL